MTRKRPPRKKKGWHSREFSTSSFQTLGFVMSALKPSLLRLLTAHDTVGARQVGGAEIKKTQEGELFGHGVQSKGRRYRICSSRVNPHATHMQAFGMMRNPVRSRLGSSSTPSPHRNEVPGAENSGSPTLEKALMLKSLPKMSTLCCYMYGTQSSE